MIIFFFAEGKRVPILLPNFMRITNFNGLFGKFHNLYINKKEYISRN